MAHLIKVLRLRTVCHWAKAIRAQHSHSKLDTPQSVGLDLPPVLFIAKYNQVVDMAHLRIAPDMGNEFEVDDMETFPVKLEPSSLTRKKIDFILTRLKSTTTYKSVTSIMQNKTTGEPLDFSAANNGSIQYCDVEPVKMKDVTTVTLDQKDPLLWYDTAIDVKQLPRHYLMLSKSRLTLLVCLTSAAGYGLASSAVMSFDPTIMAVSTLAVGLTSASANAINQLLEVPFDSQMNRTRNRVLVKGLLSPYHAMGFAVATGSTGALLLLQFVNPVASALAVTNLLLYTSVYTPMKRVSILNTWVGSVVGAIPPLIGWVRYTRKIVAF
jgi:hypothetical protein